MKIYIESMGCESNLADTNKIRNYFKTNTVEITENPILADGIVFMSCGFNEIMIKDNLARLDELKKMNPGAKIYFGGCVPRIAPETAGLGNYSFGPRELNKLDEIFDFKTKICTISPQFERDDKKIIRISTGCQGKCSYCAIKFANGVTKSRPIEDIKRDIVCGVMDGFKKLVLTAEDSGAWGSDCEKTIVDLLKQIIDIDMDFELSLSTIHPKWFTKYPELIDLLAHEKIGKQIYFSLQSASNKILELMRREYTVEEYKATFKKIKEKVPQIKIQTDILVGFPGETEEDFQENMDIIKELDFSFLQAFLYTDMKRTPSYNLEPKVPLQVAKDRIKKLILAFLDKNKDICAQKLVNTNVTEIHELLKQE